MLDFLAEKKLADPVSRRELELLNARIEGAYFKKVLRRLR